MYFKKSLKCIIIVFALSINTYAAIISDNDGAAFVTKSEFEGLKDSFAAQIDNYNSSIDGKIDGAIAAYLAGIRLSKKVILKNIYLNYRLYTNQYIKDIMWTKGTDYVVKEAEAANGDKQILWQDINWYNFYVLGSDTSTYRAGKQHLTGPGSTKESTKVRRIEVGKNKNIVAWGDYIGWLEMMSSITSINGGSYDFFGWVPVLNSYFAPAMRKSRNVSQSFGGGISTYREYNYLKYYEIMPSESSTLTLANIRIAPLSTKNEGTIAPAPAPTSADFVLSNTNYGENVYGCGAQTNVNDLSTTTYPRTREAVASRIVPGAGGKIFVNVAARWFRVIKYNELSFDSIDSSIGFACPFKAGLPVTNKTNFGADDKLKVIVENAVSNGYLVPYVKTAPDDTWDNKKSSYTSGDKYKITAGAKKEIELELNEKIDGYVFLVWLPDTPCVMPTLTIEQEVVA